jgi:hypothetical protein
MRATTPTNSGPVHQRAIRASAEHPAGGVRRAVPHLNWTKTRGPVTVKLVLNNCLRLRRLRSQSFDALEVRSEQVVEQGPLRRFQRPRRRLGAFTHGARGYVIWSGPAFAVAWASVLSPDSLPATRPRRPAPDRPPELPWSDSSSGTRSVPALHGARGTI